MRNRKWRTGSRPAHRRRLQFEVLEERRLLAVVPAGFTETAIATGLTSPITMEIDHQGRIWLAYQDGRLGVIEDDALLPHVAYQLDNDGAGERGFQGIVLDPDFHLNGHIYVYYTAASPESHNRLSRLTVDPLTQNSIIPDSEVVLLDLPLFSELPQNQSPIWHMGGAIHFLPDESIVVQVGDHLNNSLVQNMDSPIGKILRVHRDGTPAADNPFYDADDGITWTDYIWASGLRNPFSGDVDPATGRYFVNDVGESNWEEINDATMPGLNFGWPMTEGPFNPDTFPQFTNPFYAYQHPEDCAITGGAFYSPAISQFPAEYEGMYFFSQFCGGRIMFVDPDNPSEVGSFITEAAFPMNIKIAPDGSLYYIARGAGAGGAPGVGTGQVLKVQFAAEIAPQIVQHPADALASVGYDATFSASAAGTPVLQYQWQRHDGMQFVDIPDATSTTYVVAAPSLADDGAQFRVLVTNDFGSEASNVATLNVTADTPPNAQIVLPVDGARYRAGDTIQFTGSALDLEDGALGAESMTWVVDFHHDDHHHPFIPPTSGVDGGEFVVPTISETSANVWWRIHLHVTDSAGLTTSVFRDVHPVTSDFMVGANLSGVPILIDGQPRSTPESITGVVNVQRTLEAPAQWSADGSSGVFLQWLDGETDRFRTIATPENDTAYVAIYGSAVAGDAVFLSDLPFLEMPTNGWGPVERDTSNGEQDPGDGNPITLNGVVYEKGLGVHAFSDVRFELGGAYQRFISDIGVDDAVGANGSVVFQVYGDGALLYDSGVLFGGSATQTVDVSVAGVHELQLIVTDAGNGNAFDHADWADARLISTVTYLSDIPWVSAENGWGPVELDTSNGEEEAGDGIPITIDGRVYDKGLGVHAYSEIAYHLGGNYARFLSHVGVDDEVGAQGSVVFHVLLDNVEVFNSGLLTGDDAAMMVDLDVTGVEELLLIVTDGGNGNGFDHADWADARLVVTGAEVTEIFALHSADLTLDGKLSYADVLALAAGWGTHSEDGSLEELVQAGDLNFDRQTDETDWDIFYDAWITAGMPALSLAAVLNPTAGDYTRDESVGPSDYGLWSSSFGSTTELAADGNGNGVIDAADYTVWRDNLRSTAGAEAASSVPVSANSEHESRSSGIESQNRPLTSDLNPLPSPPPKISHLRLAHDAVFTSNPMIERGQPMRHAASPVVDSSQTVSHLRLLSLAAVVVAERPSDRDPAALEAAFADFEPFVTSDHRVGQVVPTWAEQEAFG